MAFLGKEYKLVKQENFDAFLKAVGVSDDKIQAFLSFNPSQTLSKDGDSYSVTTTSPEGSKTVTFKNGVEFEDVIGGDKIKTTYTIDGNVVTQVVVGDTGLATFKKEYNGDDLVVTITSSNWDGEAKRYYKA